MEFDQNLHSLLENKTEVKLLRSRIEYDYVICGSNAPLSCLLARALSDKGLNVAIINKCAQKVGFDSLYEDNKFIAFLAKELGIEVGKFESIEQFVATLFKYASNPDKISYFGENYRVRDCGYDGTNNYFIADISRTHKLTTTDKIVYKNTKPVDGSWRTFLPRFIKVRQLICNNLVVTHWNDFMSGWTCERQGALHKYLTYRSKTVMLFGANSLRAEKMNENEAKALLNDEVKRAVSIIKAI